MPCHIPSAIRGFWWMNIWMVNPDLKENVNPLGARQSQQIRPNVGPMLGRRRRGWASISTAIRFGHQSATKLMVASACHMTGSVNNLPSCSCYVDEVCNTIWGSAILTQKGMKIIAFDKISKCNITNWASSVLIVIGCGVCIKTY